MTVPHCKTATQQHCSAASATATHPHTKTLPALTGTNRQRPPSWSKHSPSAVCHWSALELVAGAPPCHWPLKLYHCTKYHRTTVPGLATQCLMRGAAPAHAQMPSCPLLQHPAKLYLLLQSLSCCWCWNQSQQQSKVIYSCAEVITAPDQTTYIQPCTAQTCTAKRKVSTPQGM
jgi:hypothetical protein